MKRFAALLLAVIMCLGMIGTAWAEPAIGETEDVWVLEKIGEKDGFTYFETEIPCEVWRVDEFSRSGQRAAVPATAYFQTAVNKTQGKIALTITIITTSGTIKEAVCPAAIARGDMGSADLVDLSAENLIAKSTIYINDMFEGLQKNVHTGEVRISVSAGTFSGPNGLQGYFTGGRSTIDLSSF